MIKTKVCDYYIDCMNLSDVIDKMQDVIEQKQYSFHIHTLNVDHIVIAEKNMAFKNIIKEAEMVLADGMPLVWLSRFNKTKLQTRVTGSDLSEMICKESYDKNFKIFFLGAMPGVADVAQKNMEKKYKGTQIVGTYSPSREEINSENLSMDIIAKINNSGANVLLVSFGAPLQEIWINKYKDNIKTNVNIGVGASIDFLAGNIKRAPKFIGNIGMEWLFRLCLEPKRLFKRYIINDTQILKIAFNDYKKRRKNNDFN